MTATRRAADADRAPLEEQRDFLLRSLEDLEREHEAGDIDDHDYEALRDDYTVRAAAVLRALDAHAALQTEAASPEASGRDVGGGHRRVRRAGGDRCRVDLGPSRRGFGRERRPCAGSRGEYC